MKKLCLNLIKYYQTYISSKSPPCCKFTPTCSDYMFQAIEIHGVLKGVVLGIKRILKCNPFFEGGEDPVPQKKKGI